MSENLCRRLISLQSVRWTRFTSIIPSKSEHKGKSAAPPINFITGQDVARRDVGPPEVCQDYIENAVLLVIEI